MLFLYELLIIWTFIPDTHGIRYFELHFLSKPIFISVTPALALSQCNIQVAGFSQSPVYDTGDLQSQHRNNRLSSHLTSYWPHTAHRPAHSGTQVYMYAHIRTKRQHLGLCVAFSLFWFDWFEGFSTQSFTRYSSYLPTWQREQLDEILKRGSWDQYHKITKS